MPRGTIALWFAAGGMLIAPLARGVDTSVDPAAAAKGQIAYVRYCVACHGPAGKADGPLANDLRVAVSDLTTLTSRNRGSFPHDRVEKIVKSGENVRGHGTSDMPAWGDVFKKTKGTDEATVDAAVRNLVHFVWSIQQPK